MLSIRYRSELSRTERSKVKGFLERWDTAHAEREKVAVALERYEAMPRLSPSQQSRQASLQRRLAALDGEASEAFGGLEELLLRKLSPAEQTQMKSALTRIRNLDAEAEKYRVTLERMRGEIRNTADQVKRTKAARPRAEAATSARLRDQSARSVASSVDVPREQELAEAIRTFISSLTG